MANEELWRQHETQGTCSVSAQDGSQVMIDFLIIGGGIAGLSAGARLSQHGTVMVLEAEDALAITRRVGQRPCSKKAMDRLRSSH